MLQDDSPRFLHTDANGGTYKHRRWNVENVKWFAGISVTCILILVFLRKRLCGPRPPSRRLSTGMSKKQIQGLREVPYVPPEDEGTTAESDRCIICFVDFEAQEKVVQLLPCGHVYHQNCITPWLEMHNLCPLCKNVPELHKQPTESSRATSTSGWRRLWRTIDQEQDQMATGDASTVTSMDSTIESGSDTAPGIAIAESVV
jgi:hypothetical protein